MFTCGGLGLQRAAASVMWGGRWRIWLLLQVCIVLDGQVMVATGPETLDWSNKGLTGPVPADFCNSSIGKTLQSLVLSDNKLWGDMATTLSDLADCAELREVRLAGNELTGDILLPNFEYTSAAHFNWTVSVQVLDLSGNSVTLANSLQVLFDHCAGLRELRLHATNSTGSLPGRVGRMRNLQVLDLGSSRLEGSIAPEAFIKLASLTYLDLSHNRLTGPIPALLGDMLLNLTHLDLSHNDLSGQIPPLPIHLQNASFFVGNPRLCGHPLASPCAHDGIQVWQLLAAIAACVAVCACSCACAAWRWRAYRSRHEQDADLIATLKDRDLNAAVMSFRQLRKATSDFSESCQIGVGGFGTVYAGKLEDGTCVAIKRSKREGSAADKQQFLNEVRILSQVNHRSLVRLLGCCMEKKAALLVFEYVPNGTVQDHLRGGQLTWGHRLQIAVQTADALAYLHSAADPPIFHRDVKSANILLDHDLNAKVADFGISKSAPLGATHVSTQAVQGTMGYIDPEYFATFQLTGKSDVYSFGVVLLELLSAQAAVDFSRGSRDASLISWALPLLASAHLHLLIDPALSTTFTTSKGYNSIFAIATLAVQCLQLTAKARPCMKDVCKELQTLNLQWNQHP